MIPFSTILLRLCVATFLGALIGLERETNVHNAGLRTNALVALGTALFTVISAFGFSDLLNRVHTQMDPTRIASYIVAGIGFLGGGAIFFQQSNQKVRGLTTAAAIWIVAAIGMACGAGLLLEAILATVLALFILVGMRYIERFLLPRHASHIQFIHLETSRDGEGELIGKIYDICIKLQLIIEKIEIRAGNPDTHSEIIEIACRAQAQHQLLQALNQLKAVSGIRSASMDLRKAFLPL